MKKKIWIWLYILLSLISCGGKDKDNKDSKKAPKTISLTINARLEKISNTSLNSLIVTVKKDTEILIDKQELTASDGKWTTELKNLPIGTNLTFQVFAYNSDAEEIGSGTTTKILEAGDVGTTITVVLKQEIIVTIPSVKKITFPKSIEILETVTVEVLVEGPVGTELDYSFSGVEFYPQSGKIIPANDSQVKIITTYTAPSTNDIYTYSIEISNDKFVVKAEFIITVVKSQEEGITFLVNLNPQLISFNVGARIENKIYWKIEVVGDNLNYDWKFSGDSADVKFDQETEKNSVLINYNQEVEGTVTLTITDFYGGSTELIYELSKGQFPDCLVNCGIETNSNPILKMEDLGDNFYKVVLLSPELLQHSKLVGVSNIGLECIEFANLEGLNSYEPTFLPYNNSRSISFTDLRDERNVAGQELALFKFSCFEQPLFNIGSTAAIVYVDHSSITGPENIDIIDL